MDLGLIRRLGSLRRPRSLSRAKKIDRVIDTTHGVERQDIVVRLPFDNESHPPSQDFKFKPGDIVRPREVREDSRIWLVKQNYVSVRDMRCAEVFDPSTGEYGYFMEVELEFVDEAW